LLKSNVIFECIELLKKQKLCWKEKRTYNFCRCRIYNF